MSDLLVDVRDDGVAVLTLHRPERRNAWTAALEAAYVDALAALDVDDRVRALVLTGSGGTFCPGFDPEHLTSVQGAPLTQDGRRPAFAPWATRKPIVAAINGGCAGIGLVQALVCDVRFAARGAKLTTAFARRGLAGEYGLTWLLPRMVGRPVATELLLSGRTFDADEAQRLGLVTTVCPPEALLDEAISYAADLARHCSPTSLALLRHQLHADLDGTFAEALVRSYAAMSFMIQGEDLVEGIASLSERRPPSFAPLAAGFDPADVVRVGVPAAHLTPTQLLEEGTA